ncbi:hypothetical protein ACIPSA_49965 [Streptomyces sp. NPDC086549]|uniref:hypothetical protein n=1 Tax=Streptomyces sp. NPDC086549 TaxID=3365752 RepID=UPI0037FFAFCC
MAHTFDDLVEMQKAADEAHGRVRELKDTYGRPTSQPWSPEQTEAYEKAWQAWWKLADEVQAAVTKHAGDEGKPSYDLETAVRAKARHPEPVPAEAGAA